MALDIDSLQRSLCKGLCHDVRLECRPDGALMLDTFFEFPDGDHYPIHVSEVTGGLRLSDRGHTLMRISYDHDVDTFLAGSRGLLLERILAETGLARNGGAFVFDTTTEQLSEAVFRYGQAMTRVFDLTTLSRSRVSSTFYDDLADLIGEMVDHGSVQRHYRPSKVPHAEAYSVDYRIEGSGDPVFLYGVPNRDKARLTMVARSIDDMPRRRGRQIFRIELAESPVWDRTVPIRNSVRMSRATRLRTTVEPSRDCLLGPAQCTLASFESWCKGRCPATGCPVRLSDVASRHTQKMVDTLLIADAMAIRYERLADTVVLASDDHDMVPALLALVASDVELVYLTKRDARGFYRDLLEREGARVCAW